MVPLWKIQNLVYSSTPKEKAAVMMLACFVALVGVCASDIWDYFFDDNDAIPTPYEEQEESIWQKIFSWGGGSGH